MTTENTDIKNLSSYDKDKEYLKQFENDVMEYEYTLSEIKYRGIKLSAAWHNLGIGKQLYVCLEALEREGITKSWYDEKAKFSFPVDEIPRVVDQLNKFYLKATKSDDEVA